MPEKFDQLLQGPVVVINIGVAGFGERMEEQGVEVAQVDWVPPAAGDQEMIDLLEGLL
jgi:hypothetical protein